MKHCSFVTIVFLTLSISFHAEPALREFSAMWYTAAMGSEGTSVIQQLVIQTERHGVAGSRRHQQRPQQQEQTSFSEVASAMNMRNS